MFWDNEKLVAKQNFGNENKDLMKIRDLIVTFRFDISGAHYFFCMKIS